jgi:uncharacterized protein (TIGR04168 family)
MHHRLHNSTELRKPVFVSPTGTIYLNAAKVPRIVKTAEGNHRNFSLVSMQAGTVSQISLIWVGSDRGIISEQILYERTDSV